MTVRLTNKILVFVAIFVSQVAVGQSGETRSWMTQTGTVEFTSSVPFHSFTGTSELLTGVINLADSTVDFFVDLSTLRTGIGKRDKDMRLTLNVKEYPFAEFYGKLITAFDKSISDGQDAMVEGVFTLHGVKKNVQLTGVLQMVGDQLVLDAGWDLNLKDYDIVPPKLLIVKVDEVQQIRISATLDPVKSK